MIDTVIFDLGNVLVDFRWRAFLREEVPEEIPYRILEQAVFLNPAWEEHDKGLMTETEEIWDFISAAPDYEPEIRRLYEKLDGCFEPFSYSVDWIRSLKKRGLKVYALSNWPKHVYELGKDRLTFLEDMDGYVLSYREHCSKPDPEIYLYTAQKLGVAPEECLAVEDSTFGVLAGHRAGMTVAALKDDRFHFDQSPADYRMDRLTEILEILKQLEQ